MTSRPYPDVHYLQGLAKEVGVVIQTHFNQSLERTWKEDETPVTQADKAVNALVQRRLSRDYSHIPLIGEEGGHEGEDSEFRILEDSIDGTIAFAVKLPIASFCICVLKDNDPLAAVIYDPFQQRMWAAERGRGAILNGAPIRVSTHATLKRSHISTIWWKDSAYNVDKIGSKVQEAGAKWFNLCSVAICGGLIATGTMEASVFPSTQGWETAAMQLIVEEAGGVATDIFGNPLTYGPQGEIKGHIISNGHLHEELVRISTECQ